MFRLPDEEDTERLWRGPGGKQIKLAIRGGQTGRKSDDREITSIKVSVWLDAVFTATDKVVYDL